MCELTNVKLGWLTFNTIFKLTCFKSSKLGIPSKFETISKHHISTCPRASKLEFPSFDNLLPTSNHSLKAEFLHGGVLPLPLLDTLVIEEILPRLPITNPPCFSGFV